ncbi:hypothetical protein BBOV_III008810 [Babesia bovis T2Bo]|uniref:Uncharacterized protein n=1 Tax=Babesia bovis TaxID=5865 RepID=A7APF4_BABBO|nr:hypothetical protein BBOV_III008810 [Babesia bovis T2Bo]EDO08438.1 hypothetical protein BBOV_III008810 [Babesia bovis T2Bo]|eukprot:XP_001612006.1 hypothetical protein [Babesia bovis T2Bo]
MVSSWPGASYDAPKVPDSKSLTKLRKFQQVVNQRLDELYATGSFETLSSFALQSIDALDNLNEGGYARTARSNFDTGSNSGEDGSHYLTDVGTDSLEHSLMEDDDLILSLAFTKSVQVYQYEYSNNSDVDHLLLSYDLYNTLHLALIDALIHFEAWDHTYEKIMELGIILYLLKIELRKGLRKLNESSGSSTSWFRESLLINILEKRGIRLKDVEEVGVKDVPPYVVRMFTNELQLELWSRVVMIWLRDSSLHNILDKLQCLPLNVRTRLYINAKSSILQKKTRSNGFMINSDTVNMSSSFCAAMSFSGIDSCNERHCACHWNNIRYKKVFAYVLSANTCYRRYSLEGWLILAQISMDVDEEFSSSLFFMIYMVLRIMESDIIQPLPMSRSRIERWNNNPTNISKEQIKRIDPSSFIMKYSWSQHCMDQKVRCVMSDVDVLWLRRNWNWRRLLLNDCSLKHGIDKYVGCKKHHLEYMIMFDVDRTINYSAADLFIETYVNNSYISNEQNTSLTLEISRHDMGLQISTIDKGCVKSIHLEDVVMSNQSFEMSIQFSPLCRYVTVKKKKGGIKLPSESTCSKYCKGIITKEDTAICEPLIQGYDPKILLAIVAFCISVDREYTVLHFKQSLEYLNYKDTLRKKGKRFLRQFFSWLPVRKSEETNRMLGFQKKIRTKFRYQAHKAYNKASSGENMDSTGFDRILACRCTSNVSRPITSSKDPLYLVNDNEGSVVFKPKVRFHFSLLKNRVFNKSERFMHSSYAAKPYIYNYGTRYVTFCNNCANGYGYRINLCDSSQLEPAMFNRTDSMSNVGDINLANTSPEVLDTCSFCLIDRMILLVNWLSHFVFTSGIWLQNRNAIVALPKTCPYTDGKTKRCPLEELKPNKHKSASTGEGTHDQKMVGYVSELHVTESKRYANVDPFASSILLLNEVVESAILVQLATFFNEQQYDHLLFRLALLQVLQGRWNLCLSLLRQLYGKSFQYSTPFSRSSVPVSKENAGLSCIEATFVSHLSAKILVELVDQPYLAIEQFESDPYISKSLNNVDNIRSYSEQDEDRDMNSNLLSKNDSVVSAKSWLLFGAAHLKLRYVEIDPNSAHLTDITGTRWEVHDPELGIIPILECSSNNDTVQMCFNTAGDQICGNKRVPMAMECILKSLSLDPLCYKAWLYLAHCSMLGHDYEFAYACCNRSIDCYDSCLAAWLTKAVVLSSRARSTAPVRTASGIWERYNTIFTQTAINDHQSRELNCKAIPVPFDPVFTSFAKDENELSTHISRAVGGNLKECMDALIISARFGSAYSYAGALQIACRTAEEYCDDFPWEIEQPTPRSSQIDPSKLLLVLTASVECAAHCMDYVKRGSIPIQDLQKTYAAIQSLVATAVSRKLFLSSIPFLRSLCLMFLLDVVADLRSGLVTKCGESNKSYIEEEVYGWITFLEVLSQCGHASMAELFIPLLECYLDVCPPTTPEPDSSGYDTDSQYTTSQSGGYCYGDIKRYFGDMSMIASDLLAEAAFTRLYVRSFKSNKTELGNLLSEIRITSCVYNSRKLRLLEARVLAGLQEFEQSAEVFDPLLRRGFVGTTSTDYVFEYRAMEVYSKVLGALGEHLESAAVKSFAEQCYFTTPILRCDMCLIPPL